MGPYCRFCDRRCFVVRVIPDGPEAGWSGCMSTCVRGMVRDRDRLGHDHRTAINPCAPWATVVLVGEDRGVRADLALLPEQVEVVRVDTPAQARLYATARRGEPRFLVAYTRDVAHKVGRGYLAAVEQEPAVLTRLLIHGDDTTPAEMPVHIAVGMARLGARQVIALPAGWRWLLRLAGALNEEAAQLP